MAKLKAVNRRGDTLDKLKTLSSILADKIDNVTYDKDLPTLAKQYRETVLEIQRLEGMNDTDDEIGEILSERKETGKSGSIR